MHSCWIIYGISSLCLCVQHVHHLQTNGSHCFHLQPTVKLLSFPDSDKRGFALIGLVSSLPSSAPPLLSSPLPAHRRLPKIRPIFYAHPFFLFAVSPHLSQPLLFSFLPPSLSPPQAHQSPRWCCTPLTRLPPSPQVRPLPTPPASSPSSTSCSIFNSTIQDLFSRFSSSNPSSHLCQHLSIVPAKW